MAAGGGGDALAALIVSHALRRNEHDLIVASFSWDRYLIDPIPGPRAVADFIGLCRITARTWEVTHESKLAAGGTSGLTLLARHTPARFALLDPSGGAVGLRAQLTELAEHVQADAITLVDVGGDVIAVGDEPTLSSPLADSLALAAVYDSGIPAHVVVAGPGLDGELTDADVRTALSTLGAERHRLSSADVTPYLEALNHHPSEATTLFAAAALGVSGRAEIRDRASLIPLSESAGEFFTVDCTAAITRNTVARHLTSSDSLAEAEAITTKICGRTELDHERLKARALSGTIELPATTDELCARFDAYRVAATSRGVDLGSFRRITEIIGRRRYDPQLIRTIAGELACKALPLCRL